MEDYDIFNMNRTARTAGLVNREAATTFSIVDDRDQNSRSFKRMGNEKYKLKWSKYESNILSAFHSLLESENLSDVTLFCEGQTFKAHRLVLAACSTHFENLFNQTPVNAPFHNQFFVILDGTRADDLQVLLHFMYRGEAYLHHDRINSVLRTAEVLQVKGLSEGPNIEVNSQNLGESRAHSGSRSSSRPWSPTIPSPIPSQSPRQRKGDPHLMRRQSSPPPPLHSTGGRSASPGYPHPYSASSREPFPMYTGSLGRSSIPSYLRGRMDDHLDPHPPPPHHGGGSAYSPPPPPSHHYSPHYHHRSKSPPLSRGSSLPYNPSSKFMAPSPPQPPAMQPPPHPSDSGANIQLQSKEERNPMPITANTAAASSSTSTANELFEARSTSRGANNTDPDRSPASSHHSALSTSNNNKTEHQSTRSASPPGRTPSREYDRRTPSTPHSRKTAGTPASGIGGAPPAASSSTFPSDSTNAAETSGGLVRSVAGTASLYPKDEDEEDDDDDRRTRRSSEPGGGAMEVDSPASAPELHTRTDKYDDYRTPREEIARLVTRSPPARTDLRLTEDEVRSQVAAQSFETFRRLAQAHVEREQQHIFQQQQHPRTTTTAGLTGRLPLAPGLTASDYMRFALPVRETDNGEPISGSGTKLRCPFCERTYGYETNLRAHIRQRHQGIRVTCPFCPRTFTRNNTVRRHVQREHRHIAGRIPTKFGSTRVMPDPITAIAAASAMQQQQEQQRRQEQDREIPRRPSPPPSPNEAAAEPGKT